MKPFGVDAAGTLAILTVMVDRLGELLEGRDLTRTVVIETGGRTLRPAMTLGLILETEQALGAADSGLSAEGQQALVGLRTRREAHRDFHREIYEARLRREMKSLEDSGRWARGERQATDERDPQEDEAAANRRARFNLLAMALAQVKR
ncbi:MAG: hypothetical protein ACH37Z_08690 [Anaerolineae bacterium]|nr:hypothetical protein [Ardenticatenia bacterium]MBK8540827.1 hypothetical protein [Ardenticatenia bacterium]HQZ70822.1 hypothetical protein [Anaerolineae bacterium]HRA19139.1 hypothetical protein [Anaerolineae bacterium]